MIRLVAEDPSVVLTPRDVTRVEFHLLEFLPATRCHVHPGPDIEIVVPDNQPDELAPGILSRIEEIIGCRLHIDPTGARDSSE